MNERKTWPDDYPATPDEEAKCPGCHCRRARVIGSTPIGAMIRFQKRCGHCGKTYYVNAAGPMP